ncbi:hypothetical protein X975_07512, partial [Stegodyphus mimosarum]
MAVNHVEGSEISILEIHDETLSHGAQATFSSRNTFLTYGVQRNGKKKAISGTRYIHEIIPKSSLYNEYVRKLVNETHGVFLSLNTRAQTFQDGRKGAEILKISQ